MPSPLPTAEISPAPRQPAHAPVHSEDSHGAASFHPLYHTTDPGLVSTKKEYQCCFIFIPKIGIRCNGTSKEPPSSIKGCSCLSCYSPMSHLPSHLPRNPGVIALCATDCTVCCRKSNSAAFGAIDFQISAQKHLFRKNLLYGVQQILISG